jgi:hypothetical protein
VKRFSLCREAIFTLFPLLLLLFFWFAAQVIRASNYLQPSSFASLLSSNGRFLLLHATTSNDGDRQVAFARDFQAILRRRFAAQGIKRSAQAKSAFVFLIFAIDDRRKIEDQDSSLLRNPLFDSICKELFQATQQIFARRSTTKFRKRFYDSSLLRKRFAQATISSDATDFCKRCDDLQGAFESED